MLNSRLTTICTFDQCVPAVCATQHIRNWQDAKRYYSGFVINQYQSSTDSLELRQFGESSFRPSESRGVKSVEDNQFKHTEITRTLGTVTVSVSRCEGNSNCIRLWMFYCKSALIISRAIYDRSCGTWNINQADYDVTKAGW